MIISIVNHTDSQIHDEDLRRVVRAYRLSVLKRPGGRRKAGV